MQKTSLTVVHRLWSPDSLLNLTPSETLHTAWIYSQLQRPENIESKIIHYGSKYVALKVYRETFLESKGEHLKCILFQRKLS